MTKSIDRHAADGTKGRVLRDAGLYDFQLWLATLGRERVLRERIVNLARLESSDAVLDVGCGTGTLAIAAKRHLGASGTVDGVDASAEMIARANAKARKAGVDVRFTNALAEALPFAAARFDLVLSTIMLHHLPRKARLQSLLEIRRVLKPGGRFLAVDFESSDSQHGLAGLFHRSRHGHVKADDLMRALTETGFSIEQRGSIGIVNLHFALTTVGAA